MKPLNNQRPHFDDNSLTHTAPVYDLESKSLEKSEESTAHVSSHDVIAHSSSTLRIIASEQKSTLASNRPRSNKLSHDEWDDFESQDNPRLAQQINVALEISKLPLLQAATHWGLAPFLVQNLIRDQYASFFPVQALVIPHILASERYEHIRSRDICVSSSTGSGKTLAFVLPILHSLHTRCIKRLRALCVLPSRDLALQVFQVFKRYCQGSDLTIGLAVGQSDFEAEQRELVLGASSIAKRQDDTNLESSTVGHSINHNIHNILMDPEACRVQYCLQPFNTHNAFIAFHATRSVSTCSSYASSSSKPNPTSTAYNWLPKGGRSAVDVLVCTPGRLLDHLEKTPGFTLQHVRFLVMDEADRLLNQSYQNWIERVLQATTNTIPTFNTSQSMKDDKQSTDSRSFFNDLVIDPISWRHSTLAELEGRGDLLSSTLASVCHPIQLRKLLFSATMTQDPQKLAPLKLVYPKVFNLHGLDKSHNHRHPMMDVSTTTLPYQSTLNQSHSTQNRYSLPAGLSEYTIECTAQQKPLVLLSLLFDEKSISKRSSTVTTTSNPNLCVIFTSSLESTHRLTRLLQLLWSAATAECGSTSGAVAEFSSALSQKERSQLLERCTRIENKRIDEQVEILVCSDGMSRGMDLSHVSTVINYDIPTFAKTYVHRCGRTARGGQEGKVINIMKQGQVASFLKMRRWIDDRDRVQGLNVQKYLRKNLVSIYKDCLKRLGQVIAAEKRGEISPTESIDQKFI